MERNKIASIGEENMTLCHNNNTSSAEFSMPRVEGFDERNRPAYDYQQCQHSR
jgi:hypothetical protein